MTLSVDGRVAGAAAGLNADGVEAAATQVSLSPSSASINPNQTLDLTAVVTGSNNKTITKWMVCVATGKNCVAGGNSSLGTIAEVGLDGAGNHIGRYTAPATLPSPPACSVVANGCQLRVKVTKETAIKTVKSSALITLQGVVITTRALRNGWVGEAYEKTMLATGGAPAYSWSVTSGTLPGGLSLNTTTGAITGIPGGTGTFDITGSVQDATGTSNNRSFSLSVVDRGVLVSLMPSVAGVSLNQTADFTAVVAGSTKKAIQQWKVCDANGKNCVKGGNGAVGRVADIGADAEGNRIARYTAPPALPSPPACLPVTGGCQLTLKAVKKVGTKKKKDTVDIIIRPPDGQLALSPASVDFGNVPLGGSQTRTVTLTNSGTAVLAVSQIAATGAGFSWTGLSPPFTLAVNQSTSLSVAFTPAAAGSASGNLTFTSNGSNSPTILPLSGIGLPIGSGLLAVSPSSVTFGDVNVGSSSSRTVTLTNSGTASLTVSQATVAGAGFSWTGLSLPLTLAVNQSTSFNVVFAPTAAGNVTGSLTLTSTASNSPTALPLAGNGVQGVLTPNPTSISFGNVTVGTTASRSLTLTNTGAASLSITQAPVSGPGFSITGLTLPRTLAAGQSVSFTVRFTPAAPGSVTGSLTLTSTASNSPTTVPLSGTGVQGVLSASPASVSFGDVGVGSSSSRTVTLTNTGTASLTVSQASVTGSAFSLTGLSLPLTLAVNQSATFNVIFAPTAPGNVSGSVTLTSNAANSPTSVSLSGRGVQGTLTPLPTSINFGDVTVGSTSSRSVTLTNTGTASLTISQANASGNGFSLTGLALPLTLGVNQSTSFNVVFAPTAAGSASGSVTLTSTASNSPTTIPLTGNGLPVASGFLTVSPASLNFGNVNVGSSSSRTVTLTNTGTASLVVSQANVSGAGFGRNGLSLPLTLGSGASTTFNVTFAPSTSGSASGSVTFISDAANSPTALPLSGNGVQQHFVDLVWLASPTGTVIGYNVYRATVSGGPYTKINSSLVGLTYTDATVQSGQTYYYVVKAVDSSGLESLPSNEAQAVVPP